MGESFYDILRRKNEERDEMKNAENGGVYSAADGSAADLAEDSESSAFDNVDETEVADETEAKEETSHSEAENIDESAEEVAEEPANDCIEELFGNESSDKPFAESVPVAEYTPFAESTPVAESATIDENSAGGEPEKAQEQANGEAADNGDGDLKEQYNLRKFATFASKIDLDCTMPNLSSSEIADSAAQAKLFGLASVCTLASRMRMFKKQSAEQVFCAVIAYPSGEMTESSKICEIREAKRNGAREIDVFLRISALKDEKRKNIIKSLKKYRFVIGRKNVFKLSIDSALITGEEAEFVVEAAAAAKVDYLVVRNSAYGDERTKLFFSGLCAGKLKLEFADCITNLSSAEQLSAIGTDKFLLRDALAVAATMRDEINKE